MAPEPRKKKSANPTLVMSQFHRMVWVRLSPKSVCGQLQLKFSDTGYSPGGSIGAAFRFWKSSRIYTVDPPCRYTARGAVAFSAIETTRSDHGSPRPRAGTRHPVATPICSREVELRHTYVISKTGLPAYLNMPKQSISAKMNLLRIDSTTGCWSIGDTTPAFSGHCILQS
jgi:hypothetical protein